MKRKTIECITLYSCNVGLLDAINLDTDITYKTKEYGEKTFKLKGNVAQAFLDSQDTKEVKAWDGSMTYIPKIYTPMLAHDQKHFQEKLKKLKKIRCYKPKREGRKDPIGILR